MKQKQVTPTRGIRTTACALAVAGLAAASTAAAGDTSERGNSPVDLIPAWYDGMQVTQLRQAEDPDTGDTVVALKDDLREEVANPLYVIVGGAGAQESPVIGAVPGDRDYTGWWDVRIVLNLTGQPHWVDPFTSTAEIEPLLCTINEPAFPGNIAACIANGTPLIEVIDASAQFPNVKIPIVPLDFAIATY